MSTNFDKETVIGKILTKIFDQANVSDTDRKTVSQALEKRLTERPFRVAVIGQSGVGKSTTLNSVFGLSNYVSNIAEGTTEITEKIFPVRDGFNLSVYDMPGLNNDIDKDVEYEKLYRQILPECDVIVYIINAHSRDIGEDCRILKEIVLPICNQNSIKDNIILAFNKIDAIGETEDPNDPELKWDLVENLPTEKLKKVIKIKLNDFTDKLIDENLIGDASSLRPTQVVFYSAVFNYNIRDFMLAISRAGIDGWIWPATYGLERAGKWSEAKLGK